MGHVTALEEAGTDAKLSYNGKRVMRKYDTVSLSEFRKKQSAENQQEPEFGETSTE